MNSPYSTYQSDNNVLFNSVDDEHILTTHVVNYYHQSLKNTPEVLSYLQEMGINKSEVIDGFKLGHCNRTLGNLLPEKNRKEGAALRGKLQRIGILKPNGHELFRGSIVIPIFENGIVKQIYGRKMCNHLRKGTLIHTYMSESQHGFFNQEVFQTCEEVIFCSSIFDVLTFWCAGFKNVTCYYGVNPEYNDAALQLLKRSVIKRALFAFPSNQPSDEQIKRIAERLNDFDIDCYRIELPNDMDANTFAIKNMPASESLGEIIRKAVWINKGNPSSAIPENDTVDQEIDKDSDITNNAEDILEDEKLINSADVPSETLPATVIPSPPDELDIEVSESEILMHFDERQYRIRGLQNNLCYDQLKVNILVSKGHTMHVDVINLYKDSSRNNFIKQASLELAEKEETIKVDLSRVLLKLEVLQQENIHKILKPKSTTIEINKKDKTDALYLLQSPNLVQHILDDFARCGIVGERSNILVSYIATISRKQDKPLAIIIQSTSAAGKSALMDAVLSFVPNEDKFQYSAMTGQSLFYMEDIDRRHTILAINEEEGVRKATLPLKLIQSDGKLTISSTGKDPDTGRHVAREYHVEGPVMIFTTTTSIDIDEELLNRCLVLTVDENREQTRAIQDLQRFEETIEGLMASQHRDDILKLHQNAQRLLKPLKVVNPHAEQLTFLDDKTRTRRDHKKYLTLIRSITLLHQYQREIKKTYYKGKPLSYIEVTLDDIELANSLVNDILGRSLDDMPPQTQRLLNLVDKMVKEECNSLHMERTFYQFTRRDVRAYCGWGDTQLKVHLKRLEDMEYLLIRRGGRGQKIVYELLYNSEGKDGDPFLMGLLDVESLRQQKNDDDNLSVQNDSLSGASRPQVGKVSVPHRCKKNIISASHSKTLKTNADLNTDNTVPQNKNHPASYCNPSSEIFKDGKLL